MRCEDALLTLVAALSTLRHCRLLLKTLLNNQLQNQSTVGFPYYPLGAPLPLLNRPAPARLARPDHGDFQPLLSLTPLPSCDQHKKLVFSNCPIAKLAIVKVLVVLRQSNFKRNPPPLLPSLFIDPLHHNPVSVWYQYTSVRLTVCW